MYEPHFYLLGQGTLGAMYSTEKHVIEKPSYSQTIAEKLSTDGGASWKELWVAARGAKDRPGMPVWLRMKNGRYFVVYEGCGPADCQIHSKTSEDGEHWQSGMGTAVLQERGPRT